jgi:porphobilinogen synthase
MSTLFRGQFPTTRLRRPRQKAFSRKLIQEHTLSPSDLIYPLFIEAGENNQTAITSMPGVFRHTLDFILQEAEKAYALNIPAIMLFPAIATEKKSLMATEAYQEDGLIPTAIRALKKHLPDLGLIVDVALDPYTTHGHDGIVDEKGYVLNDETNLILAKQALTLARAGADVVAPSDMMDGRVGVIRQALDEQGFIQTNILAYSAKYASAYYGPFRDAVHSKNLLTTDKKTYQMDPANLEEALREVALDIQEGADMIMVKPGLPYLDVLAKVKSTFSVPVFAYQVSGEYAMIKAAAHNGWLDECSVVLESLLAFKRAGANAVVSYYALEAARWLNA